MSSLEKMNNVVLKGDVEVANYKPQQLTEYAQNPFIEALPPIFLVKMMYWTALW